MSKQNIQISDHFDYGRLLRFTFPSIVMLIFTTIYSVVDGLFISNFAGKTPFAAINFIMPFLIILGSVGFMFGTGGGALIAKTLGEDGQTKANERFSLIVYAAFLCSVVLTALAYLFLRPVAVLMGAKAQLLEDSVAYARIILLALPFFTLQYAFQCLFSTAGKPNLGLAVTVAAGVTNMVLDAVFVAVFHWGLKGAAIATAVSQVVGGAIPLIYFGQDNDSGLRLGKCRFDGKALLKACANGASELMGNISASVVGALFNFQLLRYAGENGIAAYGVLMYVSMIFQAVFMGYSMGMAPIIGYHYGADDVDELKNLRKKSLTLIAIFSVAMFASSRVMSKPLSMVFVSRDAELLEMTVHAFGIFTFSFLLSGFGIFGSAFFTALNDGSTSAMISFLRILVFQCAAVLILPLRWGLDGIWLSIVVAEALAVVVTALFIAGKQKKYRY